VTRRHIPKGAGAKVAGLFRRFLPGLKKAEHEAADHAPHAPHPPSTPHPPKVDGPAAHTPLKPPNNRHNLDSIGKGSPAKEKNTVVLPGTDVQKDLDDIAAGRGTWNAATNRYEVNGRTYGVEMPSGTTFPVDGPGIVNLGRQEYKALQEMIKAGGDLDAAWKAIERNPHINQSEWDAALAVFKHHKHYRG
jgi:hypothetical protein